MSPQLLHRLAARGATVAAGSVLEAAASLGWLGAAAPVTAARQLATACCAQPAALALQQQQQQQHAQPGKLQLQLRRLQQQPASLPWPLGSRGVASSAAPHSQCDCPPLGGPTPDVVVVEYDEDEVDRFIELADAIEAAFPNVVVEGNPSGAGRAGAFEVTAPSGGLLHSRLDSGAWPEPDTLVSALGAATACSVGGGSSS